MIWICKCCRKNIEREMDIYSNPYLLDPLWLHLKEQHKEKYEMMMDFENPYDIKEMYIMTNEEHILLLFIWKHPEFANLHPSLGLNMWGDILYHCEIIAESNLHGLPLDKLGYQIPTDWNIVKSIANVLNDERI